MVPARLGPEAYTEAMAKDMRKLGWGARAGFGLALVAGLPAVPLAGAVVGRDAPVCSAGKSAVQVRVHGFKEATGTVKVTLYDPAGYLRKGRALRKVKVPVDGASALDVCVAVPHPGPYSVVVHHDLNSNSDKDRADGGGYSRNPPLSITNLRPGFSQTSFEVGSSPRLVPVQLQYLHGLAIRPVRS